MIEKLNIDPTQSVATNHCIINKINELVDAVNTIQKEREVERFEIQEWIDILETVRKSVDVHKKQIDKLQLVKDVIFNRIDTLNNAICDIQNRIIALDDPIYNEAEPDFITTTYMTNGHIKEYYGQNGVSIVTDDPLPAGYVITIREPETKGGDNE